MESHSGEDTKGRTGDANDEKATEVRQEKQICSNQSCTEIQWYEVIPYHVEVE